MSLNTLVNNSPGKKARLKQTLGAVGHVLRAAKDTETSGFKSQDEGGWAHLGVLVQLGQHGLCPKIKPAPSQIDIPSRFLDPRNSRNE